MIVCEPMVDPGPFQEVMKGNIVKLILLGCVLVAGNLLFKKLERKLKNRRRSR